VPIAGLTAAVHVIEADRIALLQGAPPRVPVPRDEARAQEVWRCPTCQVALFSLYTRPEVRFVRVGTLDDPAALEPDVHIYTRSKLPWVTLPEGVQAVDVYYDMRELWPAASLERLKGL
jgi:hypothetical protein